MRWLRRKKVTPTPVSAEVAEAHLNDVISGAKEHGEASEIMFMSGPEALKFLENIFGDEEGGLPDDIREFFTPDPDGPDAA